MQFKVDYSARDWLTLEQQLTLLMMPAAKRKRLMWRIGAKGMIPLARRNVKAQQTPDGTPFKRRRHGSRKMLTKLPRYLTAESSTADKAVVRFKYASGYDGGRSSPGMVANVHQRGMAVRRTAEQARQFNQVNADKTCSLNQARKLKQLGYRRPGVPDRDSAGRYIKSGKQNRQVSMKWMRENLTFRQAGLLIKKLGQKHPRQSWVITLPARPFLGATSAQAREIIARQLQGIDYGWQVKAQDIKGK
ncbi:virion morphogenesis protein [Salmonella enterica]|nr:virion morphogenesis protein [Salmonella enterica]EBP5663788.1 virion morphogenesis protein [Salmonella enterica]